MPLQNIKQKVWIGTSGWSYRHWLDIFYPKKTSSLQQFRYYQKSFGTVEINNSFYRLPTAETFRNWGKQSPRDFIFSVKASRYITHMKKLKNTSENVAKFITNVSVLEEKLGPILFQLPPNWKQNRGRLQDFLEHLPSGYRYAFEFRNASWYTDEVYELLEKHNCAFCIYELDGHLSPLRITADFVYIRLHGPKGKYQGSYSQHELAKWKENILSWSKETYIYFDNDQNGYAVFNAKQLKTMFHDID